MEFFTDLPLLSSLIALFHDLPGTLASWSQALGVWFYVVLFLIIFAETGLVVTPFLPGDSLLFALGAMTAIAGGPDLYACLISLTIAAILGDAVNYSVGRWMSQRFFTNKAARFLNPAHLEKAQQFYAKYGGRAIIFARFAPIVRTYAPFVAGMSRMNYTKFATYNVIGGVVWIFSFTIAGHFFGNLPAVKKNFQYVIIGIILVSLLPIVVEYVRARAAKPEKAA